MAVFQKAYQGFDGPLSTPHHRTLVIFRYALADVFRSRLFAAFFAVCFLPTLGMLCFIYMYYNLELLTQFDIPVEDLMTIDGDFFALLMQLPQMFLVFVMVMAIGPTMISPDLRNNAMPLYLSRSITKGSYIFGKLLVLLFLGSIIIWIPSLLLILIQVYLGEEGWLINNLHIPVAAIVSSLCWIVSLSLLAFAVSAWVKWKAVARMFFFGIILLGSTLGQVIEQIFGGWGGNVVNLSAALEVIVAVLYDTDTSQIPVSSQMPFWAAAMVFLIVSGFAIIVLMRRIRAFQVVS
jgi:ABC-type transport system involved in multi-copper enzyme maturation permease subunit